ncbi:MAG: TonB-dependent receptor [Reichenbachiella sp.]|uniref:TonB-dependent receptor n=3 Tax=Reichenbachiella sp. TaxID=2184521 RepID=UPI003265F1F6
MKKIIWIYLLVIFTGIAFPKSIWAQKGTFTISGYIKDVQDGESIIGATIYVPALEKGAVTNIYGFYSLTLPQGTYDVKYSYLGYQLQQKSISFDQDQTLDVELKSEILEMDELVITGERMDKNVSEVKMSTERLEIKQIKNIPALMGEVDIIRGVQLLPGVQSAGEGTTGVLVRGGSADQTLIQMDEATVFNPSHFMGFFSVFNPDAIKDLEIYKGGIPSRYGGRLSSIMDVRMKEGNKKKFAASGGIGMISSRLTVEAPIIKDKSSFIISGRRTYADMFAKLSKDTSVRKNKLFFYDLNSKINYTINDKNKVFVSGYFGRDVFDFDDEFRLEWGNKTATVRWNHLFNNRLFLNTTVLYSNFDYLINIDDPAESFNWTSQLQEYSGKLDFTFFANPNNQIDFGYHTIYHKFSPADIKPTKKSLIGAFKLADQFALEHALYVGNKQKINDKLSVEYGVRYSLFQNFGKADVYTYSNPNDRKRNEITDTVRYESRELINYHGGFEPRIAARYLLNETSSLKASYNRTRQYLQIASNSTAGLPIDRWIPSDSYIKPQIADQIALGYFRNLNENKFEISVEAYYKKMQNQIDFKDGAELLLSENIETEILSGKAWSYGAEFLIKKNQGRTTGWIGYTLSKTRRQVPGINGGKAYSPRYDRTHDISVVVSHELNDRITLSGNWVFTTGSAVSRPKGKYTYEGHSVAYYDPLDRNGARMPNYHRMDLSVNIESKKNKTRRWQGSWNFSIYNAYMKKNPWSIQYKDVINGNPNLDETDNVTVQSKEFRPVSTILFKIVPSVSYNFRF